MDDYEELENILRKQKQTILIIFLGMYTIIILSVGFLLGQTLSTIIYENILNTQKIMVEKNISSDRICLIDNKSYMLGYCPELCDAYEYDKQLLAEAQDDYIFINKIDINHNMTQEEINIRLKEKHEWTLS